MKATLDAVIALEFQVSEFAILLDAFQVVAGDDSPSWLSVVRAELSRLESVLELVSSSARAGRGVWGLWPPWRHKSHGRIHLVACPRLRLLWLMLRALINLKLITTNERISNEKELYRSYTSYKVRWSEM